MTNALRNPAATASYLILKKGEEILLMRRCNTGYQDGNYQVPAGHIDAGELPTEALIREMKEEIGITIKPEYIRFVHTGFRPKADSTGDRVDYYFEVDRWEGEVTNTEPEKCDDLLWVTPTTMPTNTTPHVKVAIECIVRGEFFSELSTDYLKETVMYVLE